MKHPKPRSLDDSVLRFYYFCLWGPGGTKNTQKTENYSMGVQSFGHNSKTNQDIKNRNSSLTSPINSEDNDI